MTVNSLFKNHLNTPETLLAYSLGERLSELNPDQAVTEVTGWEFSFEEFASEGHCELTLDRTWPHRIQTGWNGESAVQNVEIGCWRVTWNGISFRVVQASWSNPCGGDQAQWIISQSQDTANAFFRAVCRWADELRQVVLSFSGGHWQRSRKLYQAIQESHLDSLVFPQNFKQQIVGDFERFLASRERYLSFGAAWKRGVLLTGPPGNGKTHFIRALINHLQIPCFYVKSFEMRDHFASSGIQYVYRTVRRTRPCILVLEDLDALIDDSNRTYFLNELDGFESNDGIITVATTNHPERLDSAILERPSRFDQKWHFPLPEVTERHKYFERWNAKLPEIARLVEPELASLATDSERFSYAFLKELCLGSILKWVQEGSPPRLFDTMNRYRKLLVEQSPSLSGPPANNPLL